MILPVLMRYLGVSTPKPVTRETSLKGHLTIMFRLIECFAHSRRHYQSFVSVDLTTVLQE